MVDLKRQIIQAAKIETYMKHDENDKLTRIARDIATNPQRYNFEFPII